MSVRVIRTQFDPRSIANLTGWYDAIDAAGYVESSGQITEWSDKSGGGRSLTQTVANNRPTLFESSGNVQGSTRAVINGRQALYFDGVNDRLRTSTTVTSGQSRTVFAVARRVDNLDFGTVATMGEGIGGVSRWLCRYGTAALPTVGGDGFATNQSLSAGVQADWTSAHVSCWSQSASTRNLSYFLNGTSLAITSNPPTAQTAFAGMTIGMLQDNQIQFFFGRIGEVLVYDRELSAAERDAVTRYLGGRWGVTVS